MKAISLWQFWASAVALRLKHNETRSWSTHYRGPIAIHAAKRHKRDQRGMWSHLMLRSDFAEPMRAAGYSTFEQLPFGAVVAVAHLTEVVPTEVMLHCELVGELEMALGDYGINRFVWRLENIKRLRQLYFVSGRQGFFEVPDNLMIV